MYDLGTVTMKSSCLGTGGESRYPIGYSSEVPSPAPWAALTVEEQQQFAVQEEWQPGPARASSMMPYDGRQLERAPALPSFQRRAMVERGAVSGGLQLTAPPRFYNPEHHALEGSSCHCSGGCPFCQGVDPQMEAPFDQVQMKPEVCRSLEGFPSVGSAQHWSGECRPCAHYWRSTGCSRGEHCERCHLCSAADFHEYRRGLKDAQRARRTAARRSHVRGGRPFEFM
eukprot:TRINITY_DN69229_c0_g1_i2.p1 TRINITY_DN69229_c0_g1~~TRINITY_DN69229_c0_g1_i2.p1  ORF type:complete len:249 (-),score=20.86 TRINITY_DN69229_c0_g1_i2:79-759(-)